MIPVFLGADVGFLHCDTDMYFVLVGETYGKNYQKLKLSRKCQYCA